MENNPLDGQTDITRFLEKFNQGNPTADTSTPLWSGITANQSTTPARQEQYNKSFERLEEKINELEEKFAASTAQNEAVMRELARTRQAVENQKSRDAFFANITATIANLKESVENLSRARQTPRVYDATMAPGRVFDAPAAAPAAGEYLAMSHYQPDNYHASTAPISPAQEEWQTERKEALEKLESAQTENSEKERIISNLKQKASQLKAVNVALDREIKRAQQERTEALRKSAEQAKEILSLRDALTAAEERFKSFNFEGRIISVKRQYEQKVSRLENELHEISATCMKQVEEIELLKNENLKLQQVAEEREQLAALYEAKTRELETLQASMDQLRANAADPSVLEDFKRRMHLLQAEHDSLSQRLMQTQETLKTVNAEKQALKENFKALMEKIKENDAVIEDLKQKIAVLTKENQELKKGQAAKTVLYQRTPVANRPVKTEMKPQVKTAAQSQPIEMQDTAEATVKTEADLPEIRVADPVPQAELEMYNGQDFLEKTNSFIGRMKWSIFREDK